MCPMRWERGGVLEGQEEPMWWQQKAQEQCPSPGHCSVIHLQLSAGSLL